MARTILVLFGFDMLEEKAISGRELKIDFLNTIDEGILQHNSMIGYG